MDLTTIIITVIALACFAIPIALDQKSKKKKVRLEKLLLEEAKKHDLQLDQHESWGTHYAIGIDTSAKKLLYVNTEKGDNSEHILDLKDYNGCRASTVYGAKKANETKGSDYVKLLLSGKQNGNPDVELEFFNSSGNRVLQNEVNLAEKWAGIIKKKLSKN